MQASRDEMKGSDHARTGCSRVDYSASILMQKARKSARFDGTSLKNASPATQARHQTQSGFTLIELIFTMLIVSILALTALPRFFDRATFDTLAFFNQTQAMLRYAHQLAIAQNRAVFVRLNGASIALCFDAGCTAPVTSPAGQNSGSNATLAACSASDTWFCEAVPNGITYTALNAAATSYVASNPSFYFNALGKPFNTGDTAPTSNFNQPLTLSVTGDSTRSIIIEQETGYVH